MYSPYGSSSTFLAVLDGRFLPVVDFDIKQENDMTNVYGMNSPTAKQSIPSSSMITGTIITRREPYARPRHSVLHVYTDVRKIILKNLDIMYDKEIDDYNEEILHKIDFSAGEWAEAQRR